MAHKPKVLVLKKGQRCKKGWTSIEVKVGKVTQRACVRGKVTTKLSWTEAFWMTAEGLLSMDGRKNRFLGKSTP